MQEPKPVIVQAGDNVLICLTEEPTAEMEDLISSQLEGHLEGVHVAILGGVSAVLVRRAEVTE